MQKVVEFIKNAANQCRKVGTGRFKEIKGVPPDDPVLLEMAKLLNEIGLNLELKLKLMALVEARKANDGKTV